MFIEIYDRAFNCIKGGTVFAKVEMSRAELGPSGTIVSSESRKVSCQRNHHMETGIQ